MGEPGNILHFAKNNISDHIKCSVRDKRNFMHYLMTHEGLVQLIFLKIQKSHSFFLPFSFFGKNETIYTSTPHT